MPCNNDTFGDPSQGNPKTCYVQNFGPTQAPVPVDLSSMANINSIYTDGTTFSSTGGFDGAGKAYSANLLGPSLLWDGTPFSFGAPNVPNGVTSKTVSLPSGSFRALKMLAAGHSGDEPSQTFVVTYADGSTATFTQSISRAKSPEDYAGESVAAEMAYRDTSSGTPSSGDPWYLYGYVFNLDPAKTVQSITLPNNSGVVVEAITLN